MLWTFCSTDKLLRYLFLKEYEKSRDKNVEVYILPEKRNDSKPG